ncbi:MAG: leucine-rich repeat domain-containing protein, partial [Candidatus Poribacteria bacterium]|nr:leucine-rich repeat domain-containing protein [Candidatus Poribacteria bacterium]
MIKHIIRLFLLFCLCAAAHAQVVAIPDPNLRAAIREELKLPPGNRITKEDMLRLGGLGAARRDIMHLTGLEHATNLTSLSLWGNPLVELAPIANLQSLTYLDIAACSISDITSLSNLTSLRALNARFNRIVDVSPVANLTNLVTLRLEGNRIADVTPLENLTQLTELYLSDNDILEISPLSNLTKLETLDIRGNPVTDNTLPDGLALTHFLYDEFCEFPPLPVRDRIQDRDYPSIFARWSGPGWPPIVNRPELTGIENVASHDLWFSVPQFGLGFRETSDGFTMAGSLDDAIRRRDEFLSINSNMVFLADIRMREYWADAFPEDWPYWVRDANGDIVSGWPGANLVDFTHPHIQDRIVQQAIAVSKCGLYDGVFFDWWHEGGPVLAGYLDNAAEQRARDNILRRIREATRADFLIMGNTNDRIIPRTAR